MPLLPANAPRLMRFLFSSLLALFLCWGTARGQETTKFKAATLTLVSDTSSVEAGKPFHAGVRIQLDEGWDVYWQFVGEIGQATKIEWELPKGFTAGPLQWPLPEAHLAFGDMLNYVYLHEVLLYATITPPAQLPAGPINIKAHITWQMCDAQNCIPGDQKLALALKSGPVQPANADLFAKWQAQSPKTDAPPFKVKWDRSKEKEFSLQIDGLAKDAKSEFFPLPPDEVKAGDIGHPKLGEVAADGSRTITFSFDGAKQNIPSRGVIVTQKEGDPREGWIIAAYGGTGATAPKNATGATSSAIVESAPKEGLIWKLFLAFIGGLIMNVMPCVLPVITLKIY
ncbi:MAG: protein-disulfide reductase DsbD domain-containing protein [Chthoniobacter sp.]